MDRERTGVFKKTPGRDIAREARPSDDEAPGWLNGRRVDGMFAAIDVNGYWVVMTRDRGRVIIGCPCCEEPFRTRLAAERVANVISPPALP